MLACKRKMPSFRTAIPSFFRPTTLPMKDFVQGVSGGDFQNGITVKRDGFHIVCENLEDGSLSYATKAGNPLTCEDGARGVGKTLAMIETHLREAMGNMFNPKNVLFDPEGIASNPADIDSRECSKIHLEFCVRLIGEDHDDLCALMHGKWAADPSAYEVHVVVFDLEFHDDEDEPMINPTFWDRYCIMRAMFPDHVVQALYDAREVVSALSYMEGIVAYDSHDAPKKVKAPHPIPMKIVAIKKGASPFIGYAKFMVASPVNGSERRVLYEVDMSDLFTDVKRREEKKAFLNPLYFKLHKLTHKTVTTSRSGIAEMVCKLNDAVKEAPRVSALRVSKQLAELANGKRLTIDSGRSFAFDEGYAYVDEIDVVLSPNAVWRLKSNGLHLQAASILAVGEFGTDEHRSLLGKHFHLSKVSTIADQGLCHNPRDLYRHVFSDRVVDPFAGLPEAFAAGWK